MNKKGFAISIILYSMVFLLISIFYMLLNIARNRYTVSTNLRESIIENMNTSLYDRIIRLCEDSSVTYVSKYKTSNGNPIDTPDGSGNEPVCYYTSATTNNDASQNGNVIFGDYCWQIVRTTADGGIKLIYNGAVTKDVQETTEVMTDTDITYTNDAVYAFTYNGSTKEWTSTNHDHSKTGTFLFNVKSNGDYVIDYTVSSEANYDKAKFYKNNTLLKEDSGTLTNRVKIDGLTTSDEIKIEYSKDSSASSGSDNVIFKITKVLERNESVNLACRTDRGYGSGLTGSTSSSTNLSGNKIYGKGFTVEDGTFKLTNTFTANWNGDYDNDGELDYPKIIGNYVCGTSSPTGTTDTCNYIFYVGTYYSDTSASTVKYSIVSNDTYAYIGKSPFGFYTNTSSTQGYMFNETYKTNSKVINTSVYIYSYLGMSNNTAYYYGDAATWNSATNMYDLTVGGVTPTSTTTWTNIRSNMAGKYTCLSGTETSCATVHYIVANSTNTYIYTLPLSNGETSSKTITWKTATSYTTSGNNFVLTDPTEVSVTLKDWYTNYNNSAFKNVYVCSDFTSTTCTELYYITYTYNTYVNAILSSNNYIFGNSVTYSNGNYTINTDTDPTKYQKIWDWKNKYNTITNSHYTCFKTDTNDCGSTVYYVYYSSNTQANYVELTNNISVDEILQKSFNYPYSSTSNINRYNSSIKGIVDSWYAQNIDSKGLTQYLDSDSVFCNDRSIQQVGGWNPTTNTTETLRFKNQSVASITNASLGCANMTDRFSVNNNKAKLTYPVGLLTEPERGLMNNYYASISKQYWLISPSNYTNNTPNTRYAHTNGSSQAASISGIYGVRPVIVLKPGVNLKTGIGTYDKPYIIDTISIDEDND